MNSIQGKGKRQKASQNKTVNTVPKKEQKKSTAHKILESVGGAVGNLVGLKDLGRDAGSWISKAVGLGEYRVKSNVFAKGSDDVPVFEFNKDGSTTITHREMVSDIVGSIDFSSTYYDLHPLNPLLFKWLSIEALGYEQYEFQGLLLCFNSTCGDAIASTNNSMGTVIITTEYDVSRPAFTSKSEMESYMFTSVKKPSESFIHPVECNPNLDLLNARYNNGYYRSQAASTFTSPTSFSSNVAENLQCLGRTQVSTQGQQAAVTIGELWVTYKIKLSKVRAPPPGFTGGLFHASSNNIGTLVAGSTMFSSLPSIMSDSTLQCDTIGLTSNTLTLSGVPPLTKVCINYRAISTAGGSPTFTSGAVNSVGLDAFNEDFGNNYNTYGAGTPYFCHEIWYTVGRTPQLIPPTVTWNNPTIGGAGSAYKWCLTVSLYPCAVSPHTVLTSVNEREALLHDFYASIHKAKAMERDNVDRLEQKGSFLGSLLGSV